MKNSLENSFKKALSDYELPYDANAWNAMNQKLSAKKWYQASSVKWSAALMVAIGIGAYFMLQSSANRKIKQSNLKATVIESHSTTVKAHQPEKTPTIPQSLVEKGAELKGKDPSMFAGFIPAAVVSNEGELIPHSIPFVSDQREMLGLTEQTANNQEPTPMYNGAVAMIDFKNRCQGESFELAADPNHERRIVYVGKEYAFTYNEPISLKLSEVGEIQFFANSGPYGQYELFGSFTVKASPHLNFSTDQIISYEDGLPKINCQVESGENQVIWHSNYALTSPTSKSTDILAFEKGNVVMSVQATASNGCSSNIKELIHVTSDYNLLAVNAFNPQSFDSRNSSFMPYALTIRQTPFKLIILDPDNGGLIFQSTDASNAWDGIDRRDGKMVPSNKAFIWKVSLQQPVAGEKSEYRGTIVRM